MEFYLAFGWYTATRRAEQSGSNRRLKYQQQQCFEFLLPHCNTHPSILANNWNCCFFYSGLKHSLSQCATVYLSIDLYIYSYEKPFAHVLNKCAMYGYAPVIYSSCCSVKRSIAVLRPFHPKNAYILVFVQYAKATAMAKAMARQPKWWHI